MYMLAEHPDVENRLRQLVFDKVSPTDTPTYDNMREMRCMRAFLNGSDYFFWKRFAVIFWSSLEVLRLYPPVWVFRIMGSELLITSVTVQSRKFQVAPVLLLLFTHLKPLSGDLPALLSSLLETSNHCTFRRTLRELNYWALSGFTWHLLIQLLVRCHRRIDLWGPDGNEHIWLFSNFPLFTQSPQIWPWPIPRWKGS